MGIARLEKYSSFAKPLEQSDQKKARALKEKNLFPEIIDCMLKTNQKLEPGIISWKEMKNGDRPQFFHHGIHFNSFFNSSISTSLFLNDAKNKKIISLKATIHK